MNRISMRLVRWVLGAAGFAAVSLTGTLAAGKPGRQSFGHPTRFATDSPVIRSINDLPPAPKHAELPYGFAVE